MGLVLADGEVEGAEDLLIDGSLFGGFEVLLDEGIADGIEEGFAGEFADFGAAVHERFGEEVDEFSIGDAADDGDDVLAGGSFGFVAAFGEWAEEIAWAGDDFGLDGLGEAVEGADECDPAGAAVAFEEDVGELFLFVGVGVGECELDDAFDGVVGRGGEGGEDGFSGGHSGFR